MRPDTITQAVPHADPEFLQAMERLPEPPPGVYERVMKSLPDLHSLFLRKRQAARNGDQDEFMRLVQEEVNLIAAWDAQT